MKKISVIVPVYNVKDYIEDCVKSLVNQSFKDYEILLINDGSTDGSDKICEVYEKKYKNVTLFTKKNGGLSDARNYGVSKSNGEYITFVDSDDYVDKFFLEKLYLAIKTKNSEISMCFYEKVPEKTIEIKETEIDMKKIEIVEKNDIFNYLLTPNTSTPYEIGTCKLIRKEILDDVKFPIGIVHEDTATSYKIFEKANKISVINEKLYYYRQREGSITHKFNEKRLDLINVLKQRQNFFDKKSKHLQQKHFIFMFNRLCRLRYEAKTNKVAYKKVDISIKKLLKNNIIKDFNYKDRIKFFISGRFGKIANIAIKLKDNIK